MKRKSRKELEVEVQALRLQLASFNTLLGMYVKYKGDIISFQSYLKKELENKDAKTGKAKDKKGSKKLVY